MFGPELNFGVPDIDLGWTCGGTVNPSCFVGHQLVVLFLPLDPSEARAELESYDKLSGEFTCLDSWHLVVARDPLDASTHPAPIALDSGDAAWAQFTRLAKLDPDRSCGAVFFFTRGGALHQVWLGRGHAAEVFGELRARA